VAQAAAHLLAGAFPCVPGGVLPLGGTSLRVALEHPRVGDAELRGDVGHHEFRYVDGVSQERAEETHGAQLHRETEAVALPAANIDQLPVGGVEVEIAIQLSPRRITRVPTVAAAAVLQHES